MTSASMENRSNDDINGRSAAASLIQGRTSFHDHTRSGFYADTFSVGSNENPYCDTTESEGTFRHMSLSEVVPRPWSSYRQLEIAAYISLPIFIITGVFAVKFVRRGRMHQSKGLMGMAQRDLRLTSQLVFASIFMGALFYFIFIPVLAS